MLKKTTAYLLSAVAVCLLSSCQLRTPKQESWSNPEFAGQNLGKTIVLGIGESEALGRQYEALFVNSLLPYVEAGSLRASMEVTGKIKEEELESVLKQNEVKTIIVTHVIDGNSRDQLVSIGYTATPYNNGYYGYYGYGYSLQANTATVSSYMEFLLETNVYDVKSKQLIWSGRKSIFDDRSDMANMEIVIKAVVKDLNRQGMLK